jgi:hypothetical protein
MGRIRTIPPAAILPVKSVPSRVEVMLSGNARSPGKAIKSGAAIAATLVRVKRVAEPAHRKSLQRIKAWTPNEIA